MRSRCTTPEAIKRANGWLAWFWLLNVPPILACYFLLGEDRFQRITLVYLALVSIWANVASHVAGWVAGRVEVEQAT
jgi:uncharacterized membrane-anchored protein YitT (DUF2179 family)